MAIRESGKYYAIAVKEESASIRILGGGLAGSLLLVGLKHRWPALTIKLYERNATLCGNHTWSFHEHDVPSSLWSWLRPLLSHSWPGHEVRFPSYRRAFASPYHSIRSDDLRQHLNQHHSSALHRGETAAAAGDFHATGWPPTEPSTEQGYQKFVGLDLRTEHPHGLREPLLMDATVDQLDGFRFVYLLPWSEHELLVEDTYYSNQPDLNREIIRERIERYLRERGFPAWKVIREESGVLPLALGPPSSLPPPSAFGAAAGLAHPVTGYTLPLTLRQIEAILSAPTPDLKEMQERLARCQEEIRRELRFFYFLNRMLFRSAEPMARRKVLERFYRLPETLVTNFYAGRLSLPQKARLLLGRPPVPVRKALREIWRY